ncbi:hypothetical protein WL74_32955 [Burkholderia cepacia]|nr:hypothetical protein WL74_32955 [Burkholderia cepacia]
MPSGESGESRVTCVVKPTVTHDGLVPGSERDRGIRGEWPVVPSSRLTLLETGQALPFTTGRREKSKH